ncbi:MAG: class I SAM-dependent methyltransferase [Nanoarchaeota archaeon]|nr:class I SAM-dependent methyltransferase [Nanoarchaeota archaeon]
MENEQEMFFNKTVAKEFAEHEQNEKNYATAKVFDIIASNFLKTKRPPYHTTDIFAGAHPDRYHNLFKILTETNSQIDWVDYSPIMLDLAKEYLQSCEDNRKQTINFINKTYLDYLKSLQNETLDLILVKYSLDYIDNLEEFFSLLYNKMGGNSILISTLTAPSNTLKSHSTNAKYFFKGKPIPEGEERKLKDGEKFTIKFFKESGNPNSGLIENAETTKYYFSQNVIIETAKKQGFNVSCGDWKQFTKENKFDFDMNVLILKKK